MKVLHRLNQIKNPKDLWLLLRIAALASILPLLLRWVKLPTLLKALASRNPTAPAEREEIDKIVRFTDFALRKNCFAVKSTCLNRALLRYHFLGKAGVDVEINFGVRKGNKLGGHSWLTNHESPYLDGEDSIRYFELIYSSKEIK